VLDPESISNDMEKSTTYRSTSRDRGSPESEQVNKRRELQGCRSTRDELQEAAVGTGSTGRELLNLRMYVGVDYYRAASMYAAIDRPIGLLTPTGRVRVTDRGKRRMQTPTEAATERKRESRSNYHCGKLFPSCREPQEFLLPLWEMDGTPRAKSDELGVDLCPGEQQLIYCLPKEGLDWK
jgi:hypothetical protein